MTTINIDQFIKELEQEITTTKEKLDVAVSLDRLKDIAKIYKGDDEVVSMREFTFDLKNRPPEHQILSGWVGLDEILRGFRYKQLIVLSAATKSGKTSFCLDLTNRLKEYNALWFPFEESAEELAIKFIERNQEPPHLYTPRTTNHSSMLWIEKKIIESIAKYDTKIVFIDHLHFIIPTSNERYDLRIGQAMRELKTIAKKWNIVIFLIAHIKKAKADEQPVLEDLRDSSFIAQEADTVIMLWREMKKEYGQVVITNNVNVSVQANRKTGKTGNVKMIYDDGKFTEQMWVSKQELEAAEQIEVENDYMKFS